MNEMTDLLKLKELLQAPRRIVITTHHKPDGDAMGSSLGLYHYLTVKGHSVQVVSPTDYGRFLHWLPGNEHVIIATEKPGEAKQFIEKAEVIFGVDFSSLKRINELGPLLLAAKPQARIVMIDHHIGPEDYPDLRFWDEHASSTAEMVYRLIRDLDELNLVTKETATCLYTGIMTDTGSFRFPSTTPEVHQVVSDLLFRGAQPDLIHGHIFDNFSENRLRFLGYCLFHKLEVLEDFRTAYITVSKKDLDRFSIITGDTEGLVNYTLSMDNINFGVLMVDRGTVVKMSFRSKGSFPANQFAAHFSGGGHFNAAGGQSLLSLEETEKRFLTLLNDYKSQLQY